MFKSIIYKISIYSSSDRAASLVIISASLVDDAVELELEVLSVQTSRFGGNVGAVGAGVERCTTEA